MNIRKQMQRNIEKATAIYQQEDNKHPSAAQELQNRDNVFKILQQYGPIALELP